MVDASRSYRMNPLAALSIDRSARVGENYRPNGGLVYPGLPILPGEKPPESGASLPLGYDLLYKPDMTLLDGQKSVNGFAGLYKSIPPGLQKPLVVPVAGSDGLGLDCRVLPSDKQSGPGMNGAGSFLRLPWISPYTDATMYPFLDMAYKASFLSQPSPFLHQQLAYQSLCAAGAGGSTPGEDRLFYLPHYSPAHISSPLGPPIQIHSGTGAPAVLSPLCQDKALQGLGPQVHQGHSAFSSSPQIQEQQFGAGGDLKPSQPTSTSSSSRSGGSSGTPGKSSARSVNSESHPPTLPPGPPPLNSSTKESLYRSTSSSSAPLSVTRSMYQGSLNPEPSSSLQSGSSRTKDASSDHPAAERSRSPAKTPLERAAAQKTYKKLGEKPLDLSAKELEEFSNGSKLEALAKMGYLPLSRYGLLTSQDQPVKEGLSPPVSSAKNSDHLETISTVNSAWVVPGPSPALSSDLGKGSQMLKNKKMDHHPRSQSSPGSTTVEAPSISSPAAGGAQSASSPSSKSKAEWLQVQNADPAMVYPGTKGESHPCPGKQNAAKPEAQDFQAHPQPQPKKSVEKANPSSQIYGDSYLPPGLGYTSRYIPYSVAESITLQRLTVPGKGSVYPLPVLLGNSSFYAPRLAPKHGLAYRHPNQGDFMAYHSSREVALPPISSHKGLERLQTQDRTWNPDSDGSFKSNKERSTNQNMKASNQSLSSTRDDVIFIDLVRDEDDESSTNKQSAICTGTEESSHHSSSGIHSTPDRDQQNPKVLPLRPGLPPHTSPPVEDVPEDQDPPSPFPDVPEEQTMRCARTSLQQFSRKCKAGASGAVGDSMRTVVVGGTDERGASNEARQSEQSPTRGRNPVVPLVKPNCSTITTAEGPGPGRKSESPACSSEKPAGAELRQQAPCRSLSPSGPGDGAGNTNSRGPTCHTDSPHLGHSCRNLPPSTCESRIFSGSGQVHNPVSPRFTHCENPDVICGNTITVPTCGKNCLSPSCGQGPNPGINQTCVNVDVKVSLPGSRIPDTTFQHFPPGSASNRGFDTEPTDRTEPAANKDLKCEGRSSGDVDLGPEAPDSAITAADGGEEHDDAQDNTDALAEDDEGANCNKNRRSGLAKRIANSSGYVGDRFKCVTTELYADSSQLSREQRALQRAMLRFSELELREKEEGREEEEERGGEEEEEEEGMTAAELADSQQQEGGGGREEEEEGRKMDGGGEGQERCQQSEGGGGGGGGGSPSAAAAEAARGSRPHGLLPFLQKKPEGSAENQGRSEEEGGGLQEPHHRFLPSGLFQANGATPPLRGSGVYAPINRHRIFSLEPFHQSSISSSIRPKRAREEEEAEGEEPGSKRIKSPTDSTADDVKKLRVCIELNGLRLNKPRLPTELSQWLPSAQRSADGHRKLRTELPIVRGRSEVNRGWCDQTLLRTDESRVFHMAPPSPAQFPRQPWSSAPQQPSPASFSSLASSRLQDKHRKLRESRRVPGLLPSLPTLPPSSSSPPDLLSFRHHDDDLNKPKGKRPFKTKHTGGETAREEEQVEGGTDHEGRPGQIPPSDPSRSPGRRPPSPQHTLPVRPVPPEVRRLIVNKNAGETLLQRAARLGYEEVVLYCLEQQICDVNHRDNAGYCALHEACARGWLGIVRHLVEHGADVNCSAQDGTRPLHDAVENDHIEVVRFLLACGADPTLTSYSGRGPINMTHSAAMATFLEDYLSDLQGRSEGDPGIYWEFYGSSVCEPSSDGGVHNILADPPGPEEEEGDEEEDEDVDLRGRREVFEFELSDRPLLPCYNIQVSLSQGPRNWLLLSDVLGRLRITSRSFRRLFPQLNVQPIPEDEFYRQASLSQLLTGPDEQELASFRPDVKDPLELVEATPELAGMLGSSLEVVDTRWDSLEASPPPTPPPPPSPRPLQKASLMPLQHAPALAPTQQHVATEAGAKMGSVLQNRTTKTGQCHGFKNLGCKMETKMAASMWGPQQPGSQSSGAPAPAKTSTTLKANVWDIQRQQSKNHGILNCPIPNLSTDCSVWEQRQQCKNTWANNSDSKVDSSLWEKQSAKASAIANSANTVTKTNPGNPSRNSPPKSNMAPDATMWEPQRLRSRSSVISDANVNAAASGPQQIQKNCLNPENSSSAADANAWKQPNQGTEGSKTGEDSTNPEASVEGSVQEPQRLRSKTVGITSATKPNATADANTRPGIKNSTATKRESVSCDSQYLGGKTIKLDAAWPKNLGNVRVHIRDLGLKVAAGIIHKDVKNEPVKASGKSTRVNTRS